MFNCTVCNTLVFDSSCPYCGSLASSVKLSCVTKISTKTETTEELNNWVGPVETPCFKCGKKQVYFSIVPPPSADEPVIVKYQCKNCTEQYTTYKN